MRRSETVRSAPSSRKARTMSETEAGTCAASGRAETTKESSSSWVSMRIASFALTMKAIRIASPSASAIPSQRSAEVRAPAMTWPSSPSSHWPSAERSTFPRARSPEVTAAVTNSRACSGALRSPICSRVIRAFSVSRRPSMKSIS